MNTEKIAKGWALIAEGAMELSLAYEGLDSAAPKVAEPVARASTAGAEGSVSPPLLPSAPAPMNSALGVCPVHHVSWTVKAGGISKNGKPYRAFWKCAIRDDEGYCNEKPTKAWADSHPIPLEAVA